jgi:hypothetical protein
MAHKKKKKRAMKTKRRVAVPSGQPVINLPPNAYAQTNVTTRESNERLKAIIKQKTSVERVYNYLSLPSTTNVSLLDRERELKKAQEHSDA